MPVSSLSAGASSRSTLAAEAIRLVVVASQVLRAWFLDLRDGRIVAASAFFDSVEFNEF